jgi:hypothetical protein
MATKLQDFWKPSFDTLYDAYFYEVTSEFVITRWSRLHVTTAILGAITASGSAVTGWALWSDPKGKAVWALIAGTATLVTIIHGALGVPAKIKEEEQRRQNFSALRVDLETFRHSLTLGMDIKTATKEFDELRHRLSQYIARTPPDLALTKRARSRLQLKVNDKLKNQNQ